jgi:hypothetical protein
MKTIFPPTLGVWTEQRQRGQGTDGKFSGVRDGFDEEVHVKESQGLSAHVECLPGYISQNVHETRAKTNGYEAAE